MSSGLFGLFVALKKMFLKKLIQLDIFLEKKYLGAIVCVPESLGNTQIQKGLELFRKTNYDIVPECVVRTVFFDKE